MNGNGNGYAEIGVESQLWSVLRRCWLHLLLAALLVLALVGFVLTGLAFLGSLAKLAGVYRELLEAQHQLVDERVERLILLHRIQAWQAGNYVLRLENCGGKVAPSFKSGGQSLTQTEPCLYVGAGFLQLVKFADDGQEAGRVNIRDLQPGDLVTAWFTILLKRIARRLPMACRPPFGTNG